MLPSIIENPLDSMIDKNPAVSTTFGSLKYSPANT
jgi:hypothetical protein